MEKVWKLQIGDGETPAPVETALHKTIKKVSEDIEAFKFNTAISAMMIFANEAEGAALARDDYEAFLKLLAPFAPHAAEELWEALGHREMISVAPWPTYDPALTIDAEVEVVFQVNGKVKDRAMIAKDAPEEEMKRRALENEKVRAALEGREVKQIIVVRNRLVNAVAD